MIYQLDNSTGDIVRIKGLSKYNAGDLMRIFEISREQLREWVLGDLPCAIYGKVRDLNISVSGEALGDYIMTHKPEYREKWIAELHRH